MSVLLLGHLAGHGERENEWDFNEEVGEKIVWG